MRSILFICMGNICRSAAAEGVMKKLIDDKNLSNMFFIDSAGTINYHEGENADKRMIYHATKRGYDITSISRPLNKEDYNKFDLIIVMDDENYKTVINRCPDKLLYKKIMYMTDFCTVHSDKIVPDPYFGGEKGFENVLDLLEDACSGLLMKLISNEI